MTETELYDKLCEKGFDKKISVILAENLNHINSELHPLLEIWLEKGIETDYQSHGISLKELVLQHEMQYQAALLTMDWILHDPATALEALKRGIR